MDKVLIGAGRHAVEVAHYMAQLSMPLSGFVENNAPIGKTVLALPVHDFEAFCKQVPPCEVMVAIGATARHALIGSLERAGHTFFSLVASGTWVGSDFKIGAGSLVAPGCVITANVSMGRHSILNIACSLSHDVSIGDFTTISPGCRLTGHVKVGDKVFLGTGAIVLPHVTIGDGAVVAAGAVVKKDVPPYALVAGDPARVIKMYAKD